MLSQCESRLNKGASSECSAVLVPRISQGVSIRVTGGAAIEKHCGDCAGQIQRHVAIHAGIGNRRMISSGRNHANTVIGAISDVHEQVAAKLSAGELSK